MALLKIVYYPDAPLKEVAEPVDRFNRELRELVSDMFDTMYENDGVGLAAPQVGVSRRMLVYHPPDDDPGCLVNPEIIESRGVQLGQEGCLSLPEVFADVERADMIRVQASDERGRPLNFVARGVTARIIQHEIDHLNGRVFIDRLDFLSREDRLNEWQEQRELITAQNE